MPSNLQQRLEALIASCEPDNTYLMLEVRDVRLMLLVIEEYKRVMDNQCGCITATPALAEATK